MTGPEHYREAEKSIAAMAGKGKDACMVLIGEAQAHATLALTAAYAVLPHLGQQSGFGDFEAWYKAAGVTQP